MNDDSMIESLARHTADIADMIERWYQDEENEKAFQNWLTNRKE